MGEAEHEGGCQGRMLPSKLSGYVGGCLGFGEENPGDPRPLLGTWGEQQTNQCVKRAIMVWTDPGQTQGGAGYKHRE